MVSDPAHYRWTTIGIMRPGAANIRITPHALYLALGSSDKARQSAYRVLFRTHVDQAASDDIGIALNQNQPLGKLRFYAMIEGVTGMRREARKRGRPRLEGEPAMTPLPGQGMLGL